MIVVRLSRTGAKKQPFYHIVVCNKRSKRDGKYIEKLGYYNPVAKGKACSLKFNKDRFAYWLSHGAQVSNRVHTIYKHSNLLKDTESSADIVDPSSPTQEIIN